MVAGLISLSVQRAVESSRRSEARYRTLVDHLPDMAVLTFDRDMRYDLVAGRGLDTFGVDPAEFEGKTLDDVVDEERRPVLEKVYREALDGEEASMEYALAAQSQPRPVAAGGPPPRRRRHACRAGWSSRRT